MKHTKCTCMKDYKYIQLLFVGYSHQYFRPKCKPSNWASCCIYTAVLVSIHYCIIKCTNQKQYNKLIEQISGLKRKVTGIQHNFKSNQYCGLILCRLIHIKSLSKCGTQSLKLNMGNFPYMLRVEQITALSCMYGHEHQLKIKQGAHYIQTDITNSN